MGQKWYYILIIKKMCKLREWSIIVRFNEFSSREKIKGEGDKGKEINKRER